MTRPEKRHTNQCYVEAQPSNAIAYEYQFDVTLPGKEEPITTFLNKVGALALHNQQLDQESTP